MIIHCFSLFKFFEYFFCCCKTINVVIVTFLFNGLILLDFILLMEKDVLSNYLILQVCIKQLIERIIEARFLAKMVVISHLRNVVFFNIKQRIGSPRRFFEINHDLILLDHSAAYIESIPPITISTITPVMSAYCISSMNKYVNQMILVVSAFNFFQVFFDC